MSENSFNVLGHLRGLVGGVVGAFAGYHLFQWILSQGLYALAAPGALLGLGCGLASGIRSVPLAILCGLAALFLGIYCEWVISPFNDDKSFSYFVRNITQVDSQMTLVLIVLGAVFGAWFGLGRQRGNIATNGDQ